MPDVTTFDYGYSHTLPTWDHRIVIAPILRALETTPTDGAILDMGCGNGAMLAEIQRLGPWTIRGVETSPSAVRMARSHGLDVRLSNGGGDLLSLFDPASFDLIISVEVIEHVFDPRLFLRHAHALLKSGGSFVVTTPYHGYLKNLTIATMGKGDAHYNPLWDGGHIKFWSRKTLSIALTEAGFQRIQFTGVGRLPYLWRSMVFTCSG